MTEPPDRPSELDEELHILRGQLQEHLGEWVAIAHGKIVGHAPKYADLLGRLDPTQLEQTSVIFNGAVLDLAPYAGQWVAMQDGAVVAHAERYMELPSKFLVAQDMENCTIFRVGPSLVPSLSASTTDSQR